MKLRQISVSACLLSALFVLAGNHRVFAQQLIDSGSPQTKGETTFEYNTVYNPLATVSVPEVIGRIINFFMTLLGTLALALIIFAGFMWMTAQGDSKKVATARNIIIWTSAGILVIFTAYILVRFVFELIGK